MKRIKLTPNRSTLSIELINSRVILLKSMLLANHRQVKSISRRLIALTKKSPLSSSSGKTHELSSILRQNTGSENSSSTSILIYPLSVVSQILRSIGGKDNRRRRSSGARQTGDLARKHTPKTKTAHVDAHKDSEIIIICAIKNHRAARNRKIARRGRHFVFLDENQIRSDQ